jgi:hypothetical protein
MAGLINERISFDKEKAQGLIEYIIPATIAAIQSDRDLTNRLMYNRYNDLDINNFMVRMKNQVYPYLDSWVQDPTKWRAINPSGFPLDI